ncbi:MAG: polymer-forming cytoskeletal protein [Deltaproteobacteria bacterium]|nr:MAG: polymer-forming cytoskeletal protein [Deltaproteobacteria bacterium]
MRIRGRSILRKTRSVKSSNSLVSMEGKTIIGEQASFEGSIRSSGDLVINGSVKGSVKLQGYHLTVDLKGRVEADIHADKVTISGRLIGNIEAREKVEITKEADFNGEIRAKRISVEDGAYLKAVIELEKEPEKKPATAGKPADQTVPGPDKELLTLVGDEAKGIGSKELKGSKTYHYRS